MRLRWLRLEGNGIGIGISIGTRKGGIRKEHADGQAGRRL